MNDPLRERLAAGGLAAGLVVPHIDGATDARRAVDAARYPPAGNRSLAAAAGAPDF